MNEFLWRLGGGNSSLLDNNPFVYRIHKGHIKFAAGLYKQYPNMEKASGRDWIRGWKTFEGWKVISFSGIQTDPEDSP